MTAPSYTEDLTDVDLADGSSGWAESTDGNWNDQGPPAYQDADYPYIQGSYAVTADCTKTGIGSLIANYGGDMNIPTDGAYFVWHNFSSPLALDTYANGGLRILVGSSLGDFKAWDVGGKDFGKYPYGGWQNNVVNDTVTADDTVGSPTTTRQYIGSAVNVLTGISKGEVHQVDAIRFGRGSSIFEFGEATDYCIFAGYATQNDNSSNRWGLIQAIPGGFQYKGKMTLGTGSNACDFRDSNTLVLIEDTPKVTANFNTIEVNNASSRVDMTNVIFKALGTVSPGRWITNANADLNMDSCQFFDMGIFTFGGTASEFLNCVWNACKLITVAGGKLNGSKIIESTVAADASAINWNVATDPDGYLDNLTVSKGTNAHHAIEFGTSSPITMTMRGMTSVGFNASDGQNDSTFYVARTVGTVTINIIGGTGNFSYKSAGATVVIVPSAVNILVHAADTDGIDVQNARVFLKASDDAGPFPFEETVTIVNSGTTATVTHTAHGMATNDYVNIDLSGSGSESSHWQNDGAFQITKINDNSYSYTMVSDPGSSPTGTIKATFVALTGLTDVNGDKSTSRVYSSNQNVEGWIRLTPQYKTAKLFGTVSSTTGYSATGVLVDD
jgi:hypothetical protein